MSTNDILSQIADLHPNALVAWDRSGFVLPNTNYYPIEVVRGYDSAIHVAPRDKSAIPWYGVIYSYKRCRFVLKLSESDLLGCYWQDLGPG